MKQKTAYLIIAIIVIALLIFYFESTKVKPIYSEEENESNQSLTKMIGGVEYPLAPELRGIAGYINTEEGTKISDFRGKVVLIDFWTYTCINCIRTFPYLKEWHKKYKDKGLVIIGVHTPEFEFEKIYDNVKMATEKYGIEYRVVQDNNYATWTVFRNRFWPRKYLIDSEGYIRYNHIGEGAYKTTENKILELLAEIGMKIEDMGISVIEVEKPSIIITHELYAGYDFALPRGQNVGNIEGMQADSIVDYKLPKMIGNDIIYLDGKWLNNKDDLRAQDNELASIILKFKAKSANIVATTETEPAILEVFIDDEYVKEEIAGDDVQFEDGKAFIIINEPRLYNVIRDRNKRYNLKLTTTSKEFSFNAFTFG
jgi:thiol-disulfide isomerase/thioredoxin